jgi:Holliday junction resolvase-like predicted endonuclease
VAAVYLSRRGASVVARNLPVGRGEIDLLVRFGGRHVAVEVKTVGPGALAGDPIERITPAKLAQVRSLAGALAPHYGRVRVDFVGVRVEEEGVTVNWRQNVA